MAVMGSEHNDMSKLCMEKTRSTLRAAKIIKDEDPDNAAMLAYYGMFYAAHGALLAEGVVSVKSRDDVIHRFSDIFIKTGRIPKEIFIMMEDADSKHRKAEFDPKVRFQRQEAEKSIENAHEFWDTVEKALSGQKILSLKEREQEIKRQKRIAELHDELHHSRNKYSPGTTEFQALYRKANELFRLEKECGTDDEEAKHRHPDAVAILVQAVALQAHYR